MRNYTFSLHAEKITLTDSTELENKYINIIGSFVFVYDSPATETPTIYSASVIEKIEGVSES